MARPYGRSAPVASPGRTIRPRLFDDPRFAPRLIQSMQPTKKRVLWRAGLQLDPRVRREYAVRPGDDRVEVEFGDLGQVVGEPGDPQQQFAQRVQVGGRRSEEHTSELQSRRDLVCRLLLEK